MSIKKAEKIAKKVRSALERWQGVLPSTTGQFAGWCYRAAPILLVEAQGAGLSTFGIVAGNGHVFNYYNGHVIDITASQFNGSWDTRVLIRKIKLEDLSNNWVYSSSGRVYTSLSKFWKGDGKFWTNPNHEKDLEMMRKHYVGNA